MLRKVILGITAFVLCVTVVNAGVGILESSEQAGFDITCPAGVVNCSDTADYSTTGAQTFALKILGGLLNFAALAAVLMLVVVGLRLVVAMGNQEALQSAKKQALWTLGGLGASVQRRARLREGRLYRARWTDEPDARTPSRADCRSGQTGRTLGARH